MTTTLGSRGVVERRDRSLLSRHRPSKPSTTEGQIEVLASGIATSSVADHVAEADAHTQYQKESEKDAANGYLGSNANNRLGSTRLDMAATDRIVGRQTAGAGASEEVTMTAAGRALADDATAGDQRTTLGLGALATKSSIATGDVDNDAVTYPKIQNVSATDRVLGRETAGAGDIEEILFTAAARALADDATAAAMRTTLGLGTAAEQTYALSTFTPSLTFGGAATGMTFAARQGLYLKIGRLVIVHIRVQLTAKGSSTGAAVITSLPFAVASDAPSFATASVGYAANMAALTSPITAYASGGATSLNLVDWGAAGVAGLDDTNFTNTSDLIFTMAYISD